MQLFIFKGRWSPYLAGALAGVLAVASVAVSTKYLKSPNYLGTSTTFVRVAGMIESRFAGERVAKNTYYQSAGMEIDWQMMLVAGIFVGALFSSVAGGTFEFELVPGIWRDCYGTNMVKRAFAAFFGGAVAMYGARWAGGCASGLGLSGMMQLGLSGVAAMAAFMVGGMIAAHLLYNRSW